jgi:hypothetical protein
MNPGDPIELTYAEPEINRSASNAHRRIILIGIGVLIMAFELGVIWNNEYSIRPVSLPLGFSVLVQASVAIAAVAMLSSLLLLFQRRIASIAAAIVITLGAFFLSAQLFRLSALSDMTTIPPMSRPATIAADTFIALLFSTWISTLLVTIVALLIHRDREQFILIASAIFFGLASAGTDAMYFLGWTAGFPWEFQTWPRMLSAGLMLVTFLLLVALLARSFNAKRERRERQSITPVSST